ncbi:33989_t:CDS:2 [Gigaspora margarita]|uniref:33989_t:CDS:1 n=1 Tax=Gigaspora margarita TaxID=4874 RepID=A0ABN7UDL5_GIGMA|nr:33989_t:CDS:2 [Gigaspora margarita]
MSHLNINILFILVKNHKHLSQLSGDATIVIDPINDLLFRYQSDKIDKIQEFTTILRRCSPQNILNVCKNDNIVTIYNKDYNEQPFDVKKIKVQRGSGSGGPARNGTFVDGDGCCSPYRIEELTPTAEDCCRTCYEDANCVAYFYNAGITRCFLYTGQGLCSSFDQTQPSAGFESGTVGCGFCRE